MASVDSGEPILILDHNNRSNYQYLALHSRLREGIWKGENQ